MYKRRFLAFFLLLLIISASGYAETNTGGIFFSTGFTHGMFDDRVIPLTSSFNLSRLNTLRLGAGWEWSFMHANITLGAEAGFASGSRFGGGGGVDFFPLSLTSSVVFPLGNILFIGPHLRVGTLIMNSPEWYRATLLAGGRLEAELRSVNFPFGLYVAGGVDTFFPEAEDISFLPTFEVGLRFPRGRLPPRQERQPEPVPAAPVATPDPPLATAPFEAATTPPPVEVAPVEITPVEVAPAAAQVPPPVAVAVAPATVQPPLTQAAPGTAQLLPPTHIPLPLRTGAGILGEGIPQPLFFQPDSTILLANSYPIVVNAGQQLAADPSLLVLIRAFAAPMRTGDSRYLISVNRARFVRDYIIRNYGIAPDRIFIEAYSAEQVLERTLRGWDDDWSAELMIIQG